MKKFALTLLLSVFPAVAASAQELPRSLATDAGVVLPWGTETEVARSSLGRHMSASVALYGRVSFPSDGDVTQDHVTWSDLFDPGLGVSLEGDVLVNVGHEASVGGYLSVGWDTFNGVRNVDDFGDTLDPGEMRMVTVIAGAKWLGWFDPLFFWEGRIGLGMVHTDAVKADFILSGVLFPDQEFFKASNRAVFELGGRVGYGTPNVAVDLGMGFRVLGAPGRGKDVTNFVSPDPLVTFMIELGVLFRF